MRKRKSYKTIPLSETTKFIVDNRGKTVPTEKSGIPLIATNCVNSSDLYPVYKNLRYISQDIFDNWFRAHPKPGDIILTLKGSQNGAVCLVPSPVEFAMAQDMVALRADENVIEPKFLFAALRSRAVQYQIKNLDVSGVIPHLKKSDFDKLFLPYPDKSVQKLIGEIYFNFCDKIDLLHRQNATLEGMAEVLFREWFVEKENDWEEGFLGDLIEVKYGKDHKKLLDGSIPVYGSGGVMRYAEKALYEEESVLIPRKGTLNNVIYINKPFWTVDTMFYTIMKKANLAKFIYFFMNTKDLASMNVGSAVPSMTTRILNNMPLELPSDNALEEFENMINPFFIKMDKNKLQIKTLENLRDTLLPKLMSGEVRVRY